MRGSILGVMMACLLSAWASATAWCDEQIQPSVPAASATAPAADAQAAPAGVEIKEAIVCQDVVDRAPVGKADVFSKDVIKVYCFCRVVGMAGEGAIVHNWYYKGALKSSLKLPVRAANWRTWSYKAMSPKDAGEWMVEILTESGAPLESVVFMVQ